jgi:hypothetical protein
MLRELYEDAGLVRFNSCCLVDRAASAAPINATAKTGIGPACFLSGSAVQNCRNVLNFKTYYECRRQRDGAGLE